MAVNTKTCLPLYNKNNKILVKLNNNTAVEEIKKQAPQKVVYKIDAYFIENNITTIKFCIAQTLPSRNIVIQITNKEKAKNLRKEDSQTKVLGSKAKLVRKQYKIIALGISIRKINLEIAEETKDKIVT